MEESTHRRIARKISEELKLGTREASLLEKGSIAPDIWADFPHHRGKEGEIKNNLLSAIELYFNGDDEAFHKLGVALHYVEDKWTLRPRTADKHTKYELEIERSKIVDNIQLSAMIKAANFPTKVEKAYLKFLESIGNDNYWFHAPIYFAGLARPAEAAEEFSEPFLDLNLAYRISHRIAQSIIVRLSALLKMFPDASKEFQAIVKVLEFSLEIKKIQWTPQILSSSHTQASRFKNFLSKELEKFRIRVRIQGEPPFFHETETKLIDREIREAIEILEKFISEAEGKGGEGKDNGRLAYLLQKIGVTEFNVPTKKAEIEAEKKNQAEWDALLESTKKKLDEIEDKNQEKVEEKEPEEKDDEDEEEEEGMEDYADEENADGSDDFYG